MVALVMTSSMEEGDGGIISMAGSVTTQSMVDLVTESMVEVEMTGFLLN